MRPEHQYTLDWLTTNGYVEVKPPIRGKGFVEYVQGGKPSGGVPLSKPKNGNPWEVVFVGNDAHREDQEWVLNHWRVHYPQIFEWFTNPPKDGWLIYDWLGLIVFVRADRPR